MTENDVDEFRKEWWIYGRPVLAQSDDEAK